jgi:hypothetical protein
MPQQFGDDFFRERVGLTSGGVLDFNAVNRDRTVVGTISTSSARTSGGNWATGAVMKLRSDMLFLVLAAPRRALLILTERNMYDLCLKERSIGRVPPQIEFFHASLPNDLAVKLVSAKQRGADEARGVTVSKTR